MKRTTVFLPEDVHERLRREAFEARVSMAHLIRRRLEGRARSGRPRVAVDPLAQIEGIVHDGRLSEGIDEALYSVNAHNPQRVNSTRRRPVRSSQ